MIAQRHISLLFGLSIVLTADYNIVMQMLLSQLCQQISRNLKNLMTQ